MKWTVFTVLGVLVCLVGSLVIFPKTHEVGLKGNAFSVDEPGWIAASYYYTDLLRDKNFDWSKWDCPECGSGSSYGSLNMHLGEWLIGIPLELDPSTSAKRFLGYYNVDETLEDNIRQGHVPPPEILVRGRTASALFGVLCCFLVFAVGFWAYNAWVGLIAAALLLANPLFLKVAGQAMTDTFYNFFLLGSCLALIGLFKTRSWRGTLAMVALCGVLTGLACSIKVTGIVAGGLLFGFAALWHVYVRQSSKKEIVSIFALFAFSTLGIVYLLNPLFWPDWQMVRPGAVVQELRSVSSKIAETKRIPWNGREAFLADTQYPQLKNLSHPLEFPLLFARWTNMMNRQNSRGWNNWHGPRLLSLHETLFEVSVPQAAAEGEHFVANRLGAVAVLLFACTGFAFILRKEPMRISAMRDDSYLIPLMQFFATYLLIALFMKLNWDRYYLPTVIALELVTAAGVYVAVERGYHRFIARPAISKSRQ